MKNDLIAFRSKFGGYNKDDVNKFILEENKQFLELESKFKSEIEPRDEKITCLESEIDTLRESIIDKDVEISTLSAKIKLLESKISELEEKEIIRQPIDKDIIEKAKNYDKICDQLDDILSYAKEEANKIIDEAKNYAKTQNKSHKKNSSESIKKDVNKKASSIIEEIKKAFKLLK